MRVGTQPIVSAPGRATLLARILALLLAAAGCGVGPNATAGHSPSARASASPSPATSASAEATPSAPPQPVTVPYGVLVGSPSASSYSISLVATDGKVAATAEASTPPLVSCAGAAGAPVPEPVSTSNSRAYYMDAQGVIRFLAPNGDSGRATTVPAGTSTRRSMFAVSPDDQRIAVIVNDYSASGASTRLYVEDLNGGANHRDVFSETGASTLWPVGWHGTNDLVVAKVPSCTQGGGPFCCGPQELHVVDPDTAARRFTLGGTTCRVAGAASTAGVACIDPNSFTKANVVDWTAITRRTVTFVNPGPQLAYLSPNGNRVALVSNTGTLIAETSTTIAAMFACAWIDDNHLLSGGDSQHQPRVAEALTGGILPVAAQGDCGGRLPGGL
jgi:hypothetical protein